MPRDTSQRLAWSRERLARERAIALGHALSPSSLVTYSSALTSYLTFCKLHGFEIEPTVDTLSFYVVYMCAHISPRSVGTYLSGIINQLQTNFPCAKANRDHPIVVCCLTGSKQLRNLPIQRKSALTTDDLHMVLSHYASKKTQDDLLFVAILLVGFFSLQRLGELVVPDHASKLDAQKIPLRLTVKLHNSHGEYTLPGHKADAFFSGSTIVIEKTNHSTSPLNAFMEYFASRDRSHPLNPFLWIRSNGHPPTRSWFLRQLRELFPPNIAGHSIRSGGATALALAGVPDDRIRVTGRWSSDAFQVYIRTHPVLIQALIHNRPSFLQRLQPPAAQAPRSDAFQVAPAPHPDAL